MANRTVKLVPNRNFPDVGTVGQDPKSLAQNIQTIADALDIGQRNTKNLGDSFVRVTDLVNLGFATIKGNRLIAATIGGGTTVVGANPTAVVGLTAVNGVATTFMRSDAAPPLDQGISPTWSGTHTFSLNAKFTLGATFVDQAAPATPANTNIAVYANATGVTHIDQLTTMDATGSTIALGFEAHMIVYNNTGGTLNKGQAVYINGTNAGWPTVALAKADSATTMPVAGVLQYNIANGAYGHLHVFGLIGNIDTSAFSAGDTLYASATVAGGFSNAAPTGATQFAQQIGTVTAVGVGNGKIQLELQSDAPAVRPNLIRGATFGAGTGAIVTPVLDVPVEIPYNCVLKEVTILTQGGTGSCTVDVWKAPYGSYPPTSGNDMTGGTSPAIAGGNKYQNTTLSGWTTACSQGDIIMFHLRASSTFTLVTIQLRFQ